MLQNWCRRSPRASASAKAERFRGDAATWVDAAARDLQNNRGASVIIAGETQPPEVHALVQHMNSALGNVGVTVRPQPGRVVGNQPESVRALVDEMKSGAVELLVILGGNPVYERAGRLDRRRALQKVKLHVHHSLHANETSRALSVAPAGGAFP